jgi:glucose/arabinose dehydrogenase
MAGCGSDASGEESRALPKPKHPPATESGTAHSFDVDRVAAGLNRPTYVGAAPGDPDALWVLEQPGRVVRLGEDGGRTVLLDMTDRVLTGGEQGLLGMAFHPDFATTRRVFLHWSDLEGDTRVAEFLAGPDGTISPRPERQLLVLDQPEENHNGGQLAFGPDGRLYLGLGDGGGAFDPRQTAQDRGELLGKIVSADVDATEVHWRVDLYGLRNPWRFSFDPALGEIWVADVGQDEIEEINRLLIERDEPPKNLGWSVFEGDAKVRRDHRLDEAGEVVWPVATYTHEDGCSVTGGFVYRGTDVPELAGRYVYGDFCAGTIWSLRPAPHGRAEDVRRERATVPQLTHIGQDSSGRMTFASGTGAIYRVAQGD